MGVSIDPVWEEIHSSREWGAYPTEHVIRFMARNYYDTVDRSKIKVLDFGCGQGANTWYLAREGFDTYAFDGSESAVKKADFRLKKEGLDAILSVYDGTDIRYQSSFFDAVIDNVCIYANSIENIVTMYHNVYRVLKRGGKLFTVCFGEKTDGYDTGKEIEPGTFRDIQTGNLSGGGLQHIFSRDELKAILETVGFKNIVCEMGMYTDRGCVTHQYYCTCEKDE